MHNWAMKHELINKVNEVERHLNGQIFEDIYPNLIDEVWQAIDDNNIARMNELLKLLDDL